MRRVMPEVPDVMNGDAGKHLLDLVNTSLQQLPDDVDLRAVRAALLHVRGEIDDAVTELGRVCAARPFEVSSLLALARLHLRSGHPDKAANVLDPLSHSAADESVLLLLAEARGREGNWQSTLKTAEAVLAQRPNSNHARQLMALALSQLDRRDEALVILEKTLAADPNQPDAWRLKTAIHLDQGKFDEASEALVRACSAGLDDARVADLYLRKAKLAVEQNALERAHDDLMTARKFAPTIPPSRLGLVSQILHGLGRDEEAIEAAELGLLTFPGNPDLLITKATALRAQGRQSTALEIVRDLSTRGDVASARWLHALLSCDCGDFVKALELLGPVTEPINQADHALFSLRGWAHQNLEGEEHAIAGERAYRAASEARPQDLWYRKGRANALRRMPDRIDDALELYRSVINDVKALEAADALTPHLYCLSAWCHYQSGDPEAAADCYTAALTQKRVGAAAQFDYALTLLAGGHADAALDEYRRTLSDIHDKDVLRQCGLIYVALIDARAGYGPHGPLAKLQIPLSAVAPIKTLLRDALRKAADEASSTHPRVAQVMHAFATQDEAASGPSAPVLILDRLALVGGYRADAEAECALLLPVFATADRPEIYYVLREGMPAEALSVSQLNDLTQKGSVIRTAPRAGATSDTRMVYVTSRFLTACGVDAPREEEQGLDWLSIDDPVGALVSITSSARGAEMVRWFVETAAERATALARAGCYEPTHDPATVLEISMLAARSAPDDQLAYRALLAHGVAGGDVGKLVDSLKARLGDAWQLDTEEAKSAVQDFCTMLQLQRREEITAAPSSPSHPAVPAYSDNALVMQILDRAQRIAAIQDDDVQEREARRAAAEVNAIIPATESSDQMRNELSSRLQSQATFYLENDDSILLMACEPAFYSSSAVLPLKNRPAVNSFAFVKAASRYGSQNVVVAPSQPGRRVFR